MKVTKSNESSQQPIGNSLSIEQRNAIDILVQGTSDLLAAEAVGVTRETVTRWRNTNPNFAAELNKQRQLIWGANHDRLRSLTGKAVDAIEAALDSGDSKVAVDVLKAVALYGNVEPPSGPTDPELVLWLKAKEWAEAEFLKKGPSTNAADIFTWDENLAKLTHQRMEELRQEEPGT